MRGKVPYLTEEVIERDAAALLAEYERDVGIEITPPIPIEDIVEKHLKLTIEFDDMHRLLGVPPPRSRQDPDILGAMYFGERRIVIDESLDPEMNHKREGRFRFTLAHEGGGHWRLHRHLFGEDPAQSNLLTEPTPPPIVCRLSHSTYRLEWQADFYAACLLMPRKLVRAAWDERFPDRRPRVVKPQIPMHHPFIEVRRAEFLTWSETDDEVLDRIARPLAEQFLVSPIAMRIRLEKIGLLHRELPHQLILAGGA